MQIRRSVTIDRPAATVWDTIGRGFADVADWASAIAVSQARDPQGPSLGGRRCTVAAGGFDEITEKLTGYDDRARTLTYVAVEGMPSIVTEATNSWRVEELGERRCRVLMDARLTVTGVGRLIAPLLVVYLGRLGTVTLRDLKTYAERGHPSRRKQREIRVAAEGSASLNRLVAVNAWFSAACGALLAAGAGAWAEHLGTVAEEVLIGIGAGLVGYATTLAAAVRRGVGGRLGRVIAGMDLAWVLATGAILAAFGADFTTGGVLATIATSGVVGALGIAQWCAASTASCPSRAAGHYAGPGPRAIGPPARSGR